MQDNIKKLLINAIPLIMVGFGLLFTIALMLNMQERNRQTDTYLKFQVCSLNIPPAGKTQAVIDKCWDRAEKATGVKVDHLSE